jgi:DNA adenine methylase
VSAKPFLKWVGGKSQLLAQMDAHFPPPLKTGRIRCYVEPFVGGGAVFLHVVQQYAIAEIHLFDINPELILAWRTVQKDVEALIERLRTLEADYHALAPDAQRSYYYGLRQQFNTARATIDFEHFQSAWIERTAQIIFLNRTGYNGLFRVNTRAQFNVPFGRYRNPTLCAADNLRALATLLQRAEIHCAPFTASLSLAAPDAFFYFDPPYRPLSATACFTSYSAHPFDDAAQLDLARTYRHLHQLGAHLMLSNSDPHNCDPDDDFFERAYAGFRIERVFATRMVNSDPTARGAIRELLILNY